MTINIDTITKAVMKAVMRPREDYRITWASVLDSVDRIAKIAIKVVTVLNADDDLTIDFTTEDERTNGSRSLDDEKIVAEVVAELRPK